MTRLRAAALALALLAAPALAACGSDDGEGGPPPRPAESVEELPKLPPGWHAYTNPAGGFAFGLPPGWKAQDRGTTTLVRSFDRLVAVSVVADRTGEALELDPGEFAERALAALPGYEDELRAGRLRPYRHRYAAVSVTGEGTSRAGVAQRVEVIVLRRPRLVNFTVVVAARAGSGSEAALELATELVDTLRSRPPSGG